MNTRMSFRRNWRPKENQILCNGRMQNHHGTL
jgi:hypothetical protein